jgi:uridine phosphorylase
MKLSVLDVDSADLPPRALVCGDPFRAESIARRLQNSRELAWRREYRTFVGTFEGVPLAVVSHGVGAPGAAVAFEQLIQGGVRTLIRVGTAGSLQPSMKPGSVVMSLAAAREDGLTHQLVPSGFPAVANPDVVLAIRNAVGQVGGEPVPEGITLTLDAFFRGVIDLPLEAYARAGILAVEMEVSALFTIAALRGARAGALLAIDGWADADLAKEYNPSTKAVHDAVDRETELALRALVNLTRSEEPL